MVVGLTGLLIVHVQLLVVKASNPTLVAVVTPNQLVVVRTVLALQLRLKNVPSLLAHVSIQFLFAHICNPVNVSTLIAACL